MRRPLIGPDSIASMAIKPLLILAVAIAALFVAPAAASAAPAGQISTVVPDRSGSSSSTIESKDSEAGINAVYTCRYSSLPPFQQVGFTCTVRFGSMQVILNCVDGRQIFGPILQAVGTYNFNLSCAPTSFSTFSVREFS